MDDAKKALMWCIAALGELCEMGLITEPPVTVKTKGRAQSDVIATFFKPTMDQIELSMEAITNLNKEHPIDKDDLEGMTMMLQQYRNLGDEEFRAEVARFKEEEIE